MKKISVVLVSLIVLYSSFAYGTTELSPNVRLRKLSMHLRGIHPLVSEYDALSKAIKNNETSKFFEDKAKEYLSSGGHVGKMIARVDELLRLRLSANLPENSAPYTEDYNSLGFLISKIVKENLSWDTLLTGKTYKAEFPEPLTTRPSDIAFYKPIAPEWPNISPAPSPVTPNPTATPNPSPTALLDVPIQADDSRVAGVITTSRFFARYNTTNINRSRGRAAAVFRAFLCDDMRAVVEPKPGEEEDLLNHAFPKPNRRDEHGTEAACMACHYKLDPLGSAFINFGNVMATEAAPGALVYKKEDGTLVQHEGRGLGDILSFLTQQDEYRRCQVGHFWKWFIRGDAPPNEKKMQELLKVFEDVGHRPNDFIYYLVNSPEFRVHPDSITTNINLTHVKSTLNRCDECHTGVTSTEIPSFTKFPIGGSDEKHKAYLEEISRKLDLKNDGASKKMPPKTSAWQPTLSEIKQIRRWVYDGAQNALGDTTIDFTLAKKLAGDLPSIKQTATFKHSYLRYASTHDFHRILRQSFPLGQMANPSCLLLNDLNRMLLGEQNPATGEMAYFGPSQAYVKSLGLCLLSLIPSELDLAVGVVNGYHRFFGTEAIEALKNTPHVAVLEKPKSISFSLLPPQIQTMIAYNLVHEMIGPGILKNEASFIEKLLASMKSDFTTYDAISKLLFFIGTQDEFLSY